MKKDKQTAMTVITEPTIAELAKPFLEMCQMAKVYGVKSASAYIVSGAEWTLLKKKTGMHAGQPKKNCSNVGTINLADILEMAGVSKTEIWRREKAAAEAADRLPALRAVLDGELSVSALPEAAKIKLNEALDALTKYKTPMQLMWDWGIEKKLKGGDRSLSDKAQIKQWCSEYHPEMPAAQCEALPGKLKTEYRQWQANQTPAGNFDDSALHAIENLKLMTGNIAAANACSIAILKDWIEAKDALARMLADALKKRKEQNQ